MSSSPELVGKTRLAYARLSDEKEKPTRAPDCFVDAATELPELARATDQRFAALDHEATR